MRRNLVVTLAIVLGVACALQAQPPANPLSTESKASYTSVKNLLVRLADAMSEENYAFKPVPEIRTFGATIAHIADSQLRTCSTLNGAAKTGTAASKTTKADLTAALKESFGECDKAFDTLTDANATEMVAAGRGQRSRLGALTGVITHGNEEYGYLAVYLRLKGVVPPSSAPR